MHGLGAILVVALVALGAPAQAQQPAPKTPPAPVAQPENMAEFDAAARRVRRLSDELRSPFCPGKTLMTCTSAQAYTLRQEMRDLALQGLNDEEIVVELKARYGDDIRNPPQPWYTALVPFLPFVVLGLVIYFIFRRWRQGVIENAPLPALADGPGGADAARLARLRAQVGADED